MSAKEIRLKFINSKSANEICKRFHYSKKVAAISQIHIGVFYKGICDGVLQFGPPIDRKNLVGLVDGVPINDFLELNRMAFSDRLPRNSESRALAVSVKMIKKHYPSIKWIVTFADGTQCGDGTIYRAAGFLLSNIKKNSTIHILRNGEIAAKHGTSRKNFRGSRKLEGFQLRYVKIVDHNYKDKINFKPLKYSEIEKAGASMYKGIKRTKHYGDALGNQPRDEGSTPISALHSEIKSG